MIGDCETAALVSRGGSIDWLCWPRFDSDACFAALIGEPSNGYWRITPTAPFKASRRYRPGTLILETLFETADGAVALIDFMPPRGDISNIVRLIEGRRGAVPLRMDLVLRFGYGRTVPWVSAIDGGLSAVAGPDKVVLRTPIETRGETMTTVADFTVEAGETVPFVLSHQASHLPVMAGVDPAKALAETEAFWRAWIDRCQVAGPYVEAVHRSLITLKAMTHAPTGGLVAAPTTSLPEQFGGERNWDYRYCWIRDSTLTLLAMMNCGYFDEAVAWRDWLQRAVAGDPAEMQIMYGLGGERRLMEWTVDWLAGHEGSKPVRVGNAAHGQFQLDVFGELMDTFHQARVGGLATPDGLWELQCALIAHVSEVWNQPDEGIWEVRGPRQSFTYSRAMAWVAVDRAIRSAETFNLEAPLADWRELREMIRAEVWAQGFDKDRNTFTQAYGTPALDASLLLLAQVGFVEASDPAFIGTVEAVERELLVDGFVQRYRTQKTDDGLPPGEGAFLACSFWLADAYAMIGREDDARALFERLLALRNDVGLLAEEYDSAAARFAGNFPQAFSHIGLVNTAANLSHPDKPNDQRAAKA
ncbi:MAG: glycoside hydrolase family 15 protein [Phenylobacterium sp.]|nr:MAG: glycoside hydrolase family 15 protein [Phenylobacterium sp.]